MTYAECFAGIGGWSVGLRDCDWFLQWQCEFDPKLQRFLAERFGVPVHGDIRTAPEADLEQVDVLIGSPPCQPFSTAGKRGGTGDERHLYPSFIATVGALKPRWVLMEQVPAILSPERDKRGRLTGPAPIGAYIGGLAALGYLGCYHCIPACAVGAPHRRDRIWILAHAGHDARRSERIKQCDLSAQEFAGMRKGGMDANANGERLQRRLRSELRERPGERIAWACGSQITENCNSSIRGLPDWAGGEVGQPGPLTEFERPSGREVEYDFRGVAHVVSNRMDRLKGLGNAVIPLIPYIIGQAINEIESA